MNIYTPYTYLIGWTEHDKWYYGLRWAKGCHPDDLWTTYFTSSKYVQEFREHHGEPDVIQVRKIFGTKEEAIQWEHTVLKRSRVIESQRWLNRTDNKCIVVSEAVKKKCLEERKKLYDKNPELRMRHANYGENNGMYGRTHTDEVKKLLGEISSKRRHTEKTKLQISKTLKDEGHGQEGYAISICNKQYKSIAEAERDLNTTRWFIVKKLKGDEHNDWYYV